jgi:hypothetical protein
MLPEIKMGEKTIILKESSKSSGKTLTKVKINKIKNVTNI